MVGRRAGRPAILLGLCLALLAAPAHGQPRHGHRDQPPAVGERVVREALHRFHQRADVAMPGPEVLAALSALAGYDHPVLVDGLLELLAHGPLYLRPTARRVIASLSRPASLERIRQAGLKHREPAVREQLLLALADGRPDGLDWRAAAEAALVDPDAAVRAAAVRAVGLGRSQSALGTLLELADDPSERVRQAVPEAVVRLVGRRALSLLRSLACDPSWRVRVHVVSALVDLKTPRSVSTLVTMLEREQGRLREDILTALDALTGRSFGLDLAAWRRFLERPSAEYLSPPDDGSSAASAPQRTVARYYGLWTLSTRFLFVTDLSISMDHVDSGRYGDVPGISRLAVTQQELARLVDRLADDVQFNLATFSDAVSLWRGEMAPASRRNKAAALKQIDHYRTISGTNVFSALELACDLAEEQLETDHQQHPAPDTVFLLTDGEPSTGQLTHPDLLLEYVRERNRVLGLRFQCVALTREPRAQAFLTRLASDSGGGFVSPLR